MNIYVNILYIILVNKFSRILESLFIMIIRGLF